MTDMYIYFFKCFKNEQLWLKLSQTFRSLMIFYHCCAVSIFLKFYISEVYYKYLNWVNIHSRRKTCESQQPDEKMFHLARFVNCDTGVF